MNEPDLHPLVSLLLVVGVFYFFYRANTDFHDRRMRDIRGEGRARERGGNGFIKRQCMYVFGFIFVMHLITPGLIRISDALYELEV
jgi:hypothetical protein